MLETCGGRVPQTLEEAKSWYRNVAKWAHPDKGGNVKQFQDLDHEYAQCKVHFGAHVKKRNSTTKDEMRDRLRGELAKQIARVEQITRNMSASDIPDSEFVEVRSNFLKTLRCS